MIELSVLIIYCLLLAVLLAFSLVQLDITLLSLKKQQRSEKPKRPAVQPLPRVTVQLPLYNEYYVAGRLIDAVAAFDYPHELLEIQVLDDSTDETSAIIAQKVADYQKQGIAMHHLQRNNRKGYKAGALQYGLEKASGEFLAIFDADFLPPRDFIARAVAGFEDDKTAMVQARWTHLNERFSWLTRIQAFFLDAHFFVEQQGRYKGNLFFNFNGTAGMWRKAAIIDAGGWEHDTITEDLDLSYRAQLKGWRFNYLIDLEAPAELPVEMNGVKNQQYRWTKGSAETALKLFPKIIRAKIPARQRLHALFHLFNSSLFVFSFLLVLFSVPFSWLRPHLEMSYNLNFLGIFFLCFINLSLFYFAAAMKKKKSWTKAVGYFLLHYPVFLAFSMALSFSNSVAVLKAWLGYRSEFVRTPKYNILKREDLWSSNRYLQPSSIGLSIVEALLAVYFLLGLIGTCYVGEFLIIPFFLILTLGFAGLSVISIHHARQARLF